MNKHAVTEIQNKLTKLIYLVFIDENTFQSHVDEARIFQYRIGSVVWERGQGV